ncbi:MAG: hypothetical protein ACXVFQ_23815 [Solirubrobacteraceae bacterium]
MTRFEGFSPQVHEWFRGLEADNSREYFADEHVGPTTMPANSRYRRR